MAKIGTVHVEVKPMLDEAAFKASLEGVVSDGVDASLAVTSTALIVAAVRLHEAIYYAANLVESLPDEVSTAYGDLQGALKRLGMLGGPPIADATYPFSPDNPCTKENP